MKNIRFFIRKFSFFGGKIFSIYSNRHVFVMPHTALSHQNCLPLTQQFFSYTRRLRKWRPIFRTRMERSYMYRGRIQSFLCSAMVRRRHKIISSYWCKIHHICDIYINQEVCRLKEFYLPRDRIYTFCAHISWTVSKLPNSTNVFFFLQSVIRFSFPSDINSLHQFSSNNLSLNFLHTIQSVKHLPVVNKVDKFHVVFNDLKNQDIWAAPCENVTLGKCGQRRPRSACASAQSDQGLHCPLTESWDTIKCFNGDQMSGWDFAYMYTYMQDDVNPHIMRMFHGIFRLTRPICVVF